MKKSIARWRDLEDNHLYNEGDPFPHDGREISPERIEELSSVRNKAGFALIEDVPDQVKEIPKQTAEKPKKAVRSREKTK